MRFSRGSSQRQPIPPYASAFRTQRRGTPYNTYKFPLFCMRTKAFSARPLLFFPHQSFT